MLNKAILMGRLTADPQLRYTPSNVAVTSFSLAVNRNFTKAGEKPATDFLDIVCWRNTAEFVSKYFKKGQLVAVEGSIQARNWTDKEGKNRKSVEILADQVYFAESKKDGYSNNSAASPAGNESFGFTPPSGDAGFSFNSDDDDFSQISSDDELPF